MNIFAKEPEISLDDSYKGYFEEGETLNGRLAMIGVIAAIGAYTVSGQLIPGIW